MTSPWSPETYMAAARFAAEAHQRTGKAVPGTHLPYFYHVCLVAMEVTRALSVEDGHDGDLAVQCALLHDVLEDTPVSVRRLAAHFGAAVAAGVQALTKDPAISQKDARMRDSLARIRRQPPSVWLVKLADRIVNLQPPPSDWRADKIALYGQEARVILDALAAASPHLARRLADKISGYGRPG
ncbi:MAG: HD domain-containing protein [Pseudomonadota bacterium]